MKKGQYLDTILRSKKTVFTLKDSAILWQDSTTTASRVRLNYYVQNGSLLRLRRGIYVKDTNYNRLELANKVLTPSYVSFETVLTKAGLIFQYQTAITVASYVTREITIDSQTYIFRGVKNSVLTNVAGIEQTNTVAIATTERAFLDMLYCSPGYYFDNLQPLNWDVVSSLVELYQNQRLTRQVRKIMESV